jgi:hypothetical protein
MADAAERTSAAAPSTDHLYTLRILCRTFAHGETAVTELINATPL